MLMGMLSSILNSSTPGKAKSWMHRWYRRILASQRHDQSGMYSTKDWQGLRYNIGFYTSVWRKGKWRDIIVDALLPHKLILNSLMLLKTSETKSRGGHTYKGARNRPQLLNPRHKLDVEFTERKHSIILGDTRWLGGGLGRQVQLGECFIVQETFTQDLADPKSQQCWRNKWRLGVLFILLLVFESNHRFGLLGHETVVESVRQLTAASSGRFYRVTQYRNSSNNLEQVVWLFKIIPKRNVHT